MTGIQGDIAIKTEQPDIAIETQPVIAIEIEQPDIAIETEQLDTATETEQHGISIGTVKPVKAVNNITYANEYICLNRLYTEILENPVNCYNMFK